MLGNCEQCAVQILRVYRLAQSCCSDCCIQPQFRVEGRSLCLSHKWSVSGWAGVGASVSYFTMYPWCQLNFTVKTCNVWPHPHFSHSPLTNSGQVFWPCPHPSSWCGSSPLWLLPQKWFHPLFGWLVVVLWSAEDTACFLFLSVLVSWGCLSLRVIRLLCLVPTKPCLLCQLLPDVSIVLLTSLSRPDILPSFIFSLTGFHWRCEDCGVRWDL